MTKADQPKPPPLPLLLVYGKPTSPDLPQASWFRIEERTAVHAAAHILKFAVIDISAETERALLDGVHEGVLKGNGRMIVGSVSAEAYQRIEEHARARINDSGLPSAEGEAAQANPPKEQTTNTADTNADADKPSKVGKDGQIASKNEPAPASSPPPVTPPDPWDALRVGSHVVAKCWDENREAIGWWLGKVTGFEAKDFVIVWLDEPGTPQLKVERRHVAILHPSFDVRSEWDKKPIRR